MFFTEAMASAVPKLQSNKMVVNADYPASLCRTMGINCVGVRLASDLVGLHCPIGRAPHATIPLLASGLGVGDFCPILWRTRAQVRYPTAADANWRTASIAFPNHHSIKASSDVEPCGFPTMVVGNQMRQFQEGI